MITPLPFGGGDGGGASDPQKASGRQRTQSVSTIVDNFLNENGTKGEVLGNTFSI